MYLLSKKLRFESAHRLAKGYVGKCANIHGHSWNAEVFVIVDELDKYDFGVDFVELGRFTKRIEENLDHKILLHVEDKATIQLCQIQGFDYIPFDNNPTCETIAKWIYDLSVIFFSSQSHIFVEKVVVNETCTTGCEYRPTVLGSLPL